MITDERIMRLWEHEVINGDVNMLAFARAIEAEVHAELRKQEPTPSQQEALDAFERCLYHGHPEEFDSIVRHFILARPDAPSYVWQVAGKTFQMLFATEEDANQWQRAAGMATASTYIQPIKVPVCTFKDDEVTK